MTISRIKWTLLLVPALVIAAFEFIRHTLLLKFIPMDVGNWLTAPIDAFIIAWVSRKLFSQFEKSQQELSREREIRAVLEERQRLARTLHDQIAQSLFFSGTQIQYLMTQIETLTSPDIHHQLEEILLSIREIDDDIRQAIFNLKQESHEGADLKERIYAFLEKTLSVYDIQWSLECCHPFPFLHHEEQIQIFSIVREAITNITKHANASHVKIIIQMNEDTSTWRLQIEDDGVGFDPTVRNMARYGLGIMRTRANDLKANIKIDSTLQKGTTITVSKGV